MCGLVGSYKPSGQGACSDAALISMRDAMTHRGPDGAGLWKSQDRYCALGHRRLAIIDLSPLATQPMLNHANDVALVFNGEIYNHADIRRELAGKYAWKSHHSDTEVLLHAYEEWGLGCLDKLQGMFAFAIYDARKPDQPVLHLVRDRVGIKPLYISRTQKGEWLFASEIRALFKHPDVAPQMEPVAFWHYLTFIVAPAPMTMFSGIFKIPAGHLITIDHQGRAVARQYWDCLPRENPASNKLTEAEAVDSLSSLLKHSIEKRMVSDVPFGVLLSGGVDSSMNVALMSELMSEPVKTFTIGYEGEEATNEFQYARRVSKRYKTDHHETVINQKDAQDFLPLLVRLQDEPIADNVCIPLYFLAQSVKQSGTTVVQVGEGADENMLGYWWAEHYRSKYEDVYLNAKIGRRPGLLKRLRSSVPSRSLGPSIEDRDIMARAIRGQEMFWGGAVSWWGQIREDLTPNSNPYAGEVSCPVAGLMPEGFSKLESHNIVSHYLSPLLDDTSAGGLLRKISYLEMKLRLPEHLLMRVDKLTMAHSVEARVPFLDHHLVEFLTNLRPELKLKDGLGKSVLKKVAEPYLDKDIIYRKKQGFGAPMESWFMDKEFARRAEAAFSRSHFRKEGFFDNNYFEGLLKKQIGGNGGYSSHIWTVLNAVLWYESWIEGKEDCF